MGVWDQRTLGSLVDDGRLRWFALFLLIHEATIAVLWGWLPGDGAPRAKTLLAGALVVGLLLAAAVGVIRSRWLRLALVFAALFTGAKIALVFPGAANHMHLGFLALAFIAFAGLEDEAERTLALQACAALAIIVLFWSAIQKILHGLYFHGEYFAFTLTHSSRFGLLRAVLPADELAQLAALGEPRPGLGPFRLQSWVGLAISNGVYVAEFVAAGLLLYAPTRTVGFIFSVLIFSTIAGTTRELLFGSMMVNFLLLFAPLNLSAWGLGASSLLYVAMIATRLGGLPDWTFH